MIEATIRHGYMMNVGPFVSEESLRLGDKVVIKTDRGTELGEVVNVFEQVVTSEVEDEAAPEENKKPKSSSAPVLEGFRVIRKATKEDLLKSEEIRDSIEPAQFKFCQQKIRELKMNMRLAAVESLFGGEKAIFYFLSESRVDFRALVKELAREYRTRIEMKQIGARDEAKLVGDYEHCGRELCCRGFIRQLEPVTIRMAKSQKATLDPSKISGACGRLMCCLRFEHSLYQELKRGLPKKGRKVTTPKGEGEVLKFDVLAQTILVEEANGEKTTYKVEEISWGEKKPKKTGSKPKEKNEDMSKGRAQKKDNNPKRDSREKPVSRKDFRDRGKR